jgi:Holliday junction resolvase RusA-like endonuclease
MTFEIEYKGEWVSVNDLRNKHWRTLNGWKNKYRKIYGELLREANIPKMETFEVEVGYRGRRDVDNISGKFLMDAMKDVGIITDDRPKYFKRWSVVYEETLPMNTYIIRIKRLS